MREKGIQSIFASEMSSSMDSLTYSGRQKLVLGNSVRGEKLQLVAELIHTIISRVSQTGV